MEVLEARVSILRFDQHFVEALEETNRPIRMTPIDRGGLLNVDFHQIEICKGAESAWSALFNSVRNEDLKAVMTEAGSPSEAWKAVND